MSSNQTPKFVVKLLLCGSYAVGKTSLVFRFIENAFKHQAMSTIGANFLVKTFTFREGDSDIEATLQLWDVAGTIREAEDVAKTFFLGSKAAIFVHDLTRDWTLDDILDWYQRVTKVVGKDIISIVIGNKLDIVEENDQMNKASKAIAERINATKYFLSSAKTGVGVNEAFVEIAREYYRKIS